MQMHNSACAVRLCCTDALTTLFGTSLEKIPMPHETPLIATLAIGLALAFALGAAAHRLRLPVIVGYLAAGIGIGPFTPGFVADQKIAAELAEVGVILLMFGVGLHFSFKDLLSVRNIAIPGALGQVGVTVLMGAGVGAALGWPLGAGLIFGLCLSVASTVVLLRALQEHRLVETPRGRIAVGWLIVEDLVMVLALVLLPPLAGYLGGQPSEAGLSARLPLLDTGEQMWGALLTTALMVASFVVLMIVLGRRIVPWLLHWTAHTGSRELFRLSVLAAALGIAFGAAKLFGVSFALGAFLAGVVLAESPLSSQAARETLPLRDAFAVLFFVSVGMLFNPAVLVNEPFALIATVMIIVVGKSAAAYLIVRAFGHPRDVAITISASLSQIGEFSFILVVLGVSLGILADAARDLVVAGAIISITINPFLFGLLGRFAGSPLPNDQSGLAASRQQSTSAHVVLVGHGQLGLRISRYLIEKGIPLIVGDAEPERLSGLRAMGISVHSGNTGEPDFLQKLEFAKARAFVVAIPDPLEAGHLIAYARATNPALKIVAQADEAEAEGYLVERGANAVLNGTDELGRAMAIAAAEPRHASG